MAGEYALMAVSGVDVVLCLGIKQVRLCVCVRETHSVFGSLWGPAVSMIIVFQDNFDILGTFGMPWKVLINKKSHRRTVSVYSYSNICQWI